MHDTTARRRVPPGDRSVRVIDDDSQHDRGGQIDDLIEPIRQNVFENREKPEQGIRRPEGQCHKGQPNDGKKPQSEVTSPDDQAAKEHDDQAEPKVLTRDEAANEPVLPPQRTRWIRDEIALEVAHVLTGVGPDKARNVRRSGQRKPCRIGQEDDRHNCPRRQTDGGEAGMLPQGMRPSRRGVGGDKNQPKCSGQRHDDEELGAQEEFEA